MTAALDISKDTLLAEITSLRNQNKLLQEQLDWLKKQIFGKRSEKIIPKNDRQLEFDGFGKLIEVKEGAETTVKGHTRKQPDRNGKDTIKLPEDLPVETVIVDLPEEEKVCKETGQALVKIGEEVTTKLAHKPGSYFIKKIVRPKYAAAKNPDAGVSTAFLPDTIVPRCFADESFLADILVKKYADHLPLNRQVEALAREEIFISRQILSQWVIKVSLALKPIYETMKEVILNGDTVFCDETPVKMLPKIGNKTETTYVWVLVGGQKKKLPGYRVYMFYEDRKHCNLLEILGHYKGVLHSDKYAAYEALANAKKYVWVPCWAHIRRKFFEAEGGDPKFRDWVLQKIKELYDHEEVAWQKEPEDRLKIRQENEIPIIDELIKVIKNKLEDTKILPKSKLGQAIRYFLGLIAHVKNYTNNPFAHIDNNVAERAIRPLAIGRKNWLFFGNENGGEAASIAYSLIQSCRELDVNPRDYLEDIMRRLMSHPANKLKELLPDQWALAKGPHPKLLS